MKGLKRSCYCGDVRREHVGEKITLMGWVNRRRDHGGVIFIDLRDRFGLVQVVFSPEVSEEMFEIADELRKEFVIAIKGEVIARPEGMVNEDLATGAIEIYAEELHILDRAQTPPIQVEDDINSSEEMRLKYRYLDLRRKPMQDNIILRHKVKQAVRNYLDNKDFLDIETPMLTKSTPEGARDFLVPSRVNKGQFFALPQSPQLFKQLLMVSGLERYYQIVRCFRDEDLRADRQPEFTQIDIEMSFMSQEEIMDLIEGMIQEVFKIAGFEAPTEFPHMSYHEAMDRFGSDRPDIRFGLELIDVSDAVKDAEFKVFSGTIAKGGQVKGINVKGGVDFSRKDIDELTDFAGIYGAKGLAWMKIKEDGVQSPIAKFLAENELNSMLDAMGAETGDLLLFVADTPKVVAASLGNLRLKIGKDLGLIDQDEFNFVWITDFPLLEWDEEAKRYVALHHPFTMPKEEDIDLLDKDNAGKVLSQAYDLVLNGIEIGGGSIRINNSKLQSKIFNLLNMDEEEIEEKFGFLLEAFQYGAPPHGGIAFGLDRLVMLLGGLETIRDVIPFPKTQRATCLLTEAPSMVAEAQLEELGIEVEEQIEID
ncbi:aspartyl-tRNA synthetase [Orenia metallireducens]|uniref:Aspartate--tRNA(Asp/Asn) ligase n=1 Tax=Orenia metallireducens TaxID=1413210 RepID=A0A285GBQ8_9FIRM|nr:aspartate--tRNA ligase [Orenia metallireducens]PRX24219.1 aspartyl-tRNA synthetase [Orenia metallireducens]SNY19831.1 aspartyl-tRNA synthetase [Orenia metallireducens]